MGELAWPEWRALPAPKDGEVYLFSDPFYGLLTGMWCDDGLGGESGWDFVDLDGMALVSGIEPTGWLPLPPVMGAK